MTIMAELVDLVAMADERHRWPVLMERVGAVLAYLSAQEFAGRIGGEVADRLMGALACARQGLLLERQDQVREELQTAERCARLLGL